MNTVRVYFALVLAALTMGCAPRVPADGRLVLVLVDDALASKPLPVVMGDGSFSTITVGEAVRQGVHYWDTVGAKLRIPEDVSPDDGEAAATLHVNQATTLGMMMDSTSSWYDESDGKIYVPYSRLADAVANGGAYLLSGLPSLMAHEAGHAMGLQHTTDANDIMHAEAANRDALAQGDIEQFCRATNHSPEACK